LLGFSAYFMHKTQYQEQTDSSNNPIIGVSIYVPDKGTTTDLRDAIPIQIFLLEFEVVI
jgi:hypothetical protein